ncbi:MAG: hypothetical protein K6G44_16800 [Lentisphaeria bacterium]|nr:hypothetical protein [Lentisphaeria bacterium]
MPLRTTHAESACSSLFASTTATRTRTVPLSYSARLEAVLKENGGQVDLVVVPGIGHENAIMKHTAESFLEFLKK